MRVERRLTPDDRAASPYLEVPFEVPPGAGSLEAWLSYDRSAGVVDLGCVGPDGFRGWSGGSRQRFIVAADAATPGYLPGALGAGTWAVLLGLHRIPAEGLDVTVDVDVPATAAPEAEPAEPAVPERPPRRRLPAAAGLTWLACDFHAHTVHSDGVLGVGELAACAVEAGLDVLAVTDHNTVSHHPALPGLSKRYGVTLLPGQEVTTDRGHANAFGDIGWVDFRRPAASWVSVTRERGGLLSINHPLAGDCSWVHPLPERPRLAEIWHRTWQDRTWTSPLAWWTAWGLDTVPIGGSDFHDPRRDTVGTPVTWVACEADDPDAVLDGLRAGRTSAAASVDAPVLLRVGDELVAVDADGTLLVDTDGRRRPVRGNRVRFPGAAGPHWLETPMAAVVAITP
ncbi:MAG: CehA/McbA family metallohydrolase [Actinomycetota bacterium]